MSLRMYALESRKRIFTSFPPEVFHMEKETDSNYSRIQERDFIEKIMAGWVKPASIDTTYFALHIMKALSYPPSEIVRSKIVDFMNSLYMEDGEAGGFRQAEAVKKISVHAIHSAIGILNLLYSEGNGKFKWDRPLGRELSVKYLGKKKVEQIINFLKRCQNDNGGFSEDASNDPSINASTSVLWCLWHLEALDKCSFEGLLEFMKKQVVEKDGNSVIGFRNQSKDRCAWICATYYAYRSFYTIKKHNEEVLRNRKIPDTQKVINFISSCIKSGEGKGEPKAFAASADLKPTIIHTKDALSLVSGKYLDMGKAKSGFTDKSLVNGIECFLTNCEYKGVYGFGERKYYFPNIYATQLALDIKAMLKRDPENKDDLVDSQQKKLILEFVNSCYDQKSGGYRGYSNSPKYIPNDWIQKFN